MAISRSMRIWTFVALALCGMTVVVDIALQPFDPAESKATVRYLAQIPFDVGGIILAAVVLVHSRRLMPSVRLAVATMGIGIAGFVFGQWYWTYANLAGAAVPYPSLADVGYVLFPVCAIVGTILLLAGTRRRAQGIDLAIGILIPLTTLFVFYAILIQPRYDATADGLRTFFDLAYPTADALYVALACLLVFFTRPTSLTPALRTLAGAIVLMGATDVTFLVGVDRGFYFTGSWIDVLYFAATGAFGLALLRFPTDVGPARAAGAWTPSALP